MGATTCRIQNPYFALFLNVVESRKSSVNFVWVIRPIPIFPIFALAKLFNASIWISSIVRKDMTNIEEKICCFLCEVEHSIFPFIFHKYIDDLAIGLCCYSYTTTMRFWDGGSEGTRTLGLFRDREAF